MRLSLVFAVTRGARPLHVKPVHAFSCLPGSGNFPVARQAILILNAAQGRVTFGARVAEVGVVFEAFDGRTAAHGGEISGAEGAATGQVERHAQSDKQQQRRHQGNR